MMSPDILHEEMLAAGERLADALRLEQYFGGLSSGYRLEEVRMQWQGARRLVEQTAADYAAATRRYVEEVERNASSVRSSWMTLRPSRS